MTVRHVIRPPFDGAGRAAECALRQQRRDVAGQGKIAQSHSAHDVMYNGEIAGFQPCLDRVSHDLAVGAAFKRRPAYLRQRPPGFGFGVCGQLGGIGGKIGAVILSITEQ